MRPSTLNGHTFAATESHFDHGFDFSPAISYLLSCETEAEFESIWVAFTDETSNPQCGWVTDRFGITWQIVPEALFALVNCDDETRRERVLKALYTMKKINLPILKQVFQRKCSLKRKVHMTIHVPQIEPKTIRWGIIGCGDVPEVKAARPSRKRRIPSSSPSCAATVYSPVTMLSVMACRAGMTRPMT
jgi:hypothetical protein